MAKSTAGDGSAGGVETRVIQGQEARVYTSPDELRVEWRPGRPVYYGVRVGDRIKNADRDVASVRIDEWEVVEVTPDRVVGRDVRYGERREWHREALERGLVLGNFATNLTDVATVAVHRVGSWAEYDPDAETDPADRTYRGRPYVTVVAYGNNGEQYGLRFRYVEERDDGPIELRERDPAVTRLDEDGRALVAERVRAVLETDDLVVEGETV